MIATANIIIPQDGQHEELHNHLAELYRVWRVYHEESEDKFEPQNIAFAHDPEWSHRMMSIQSARDGNHWVWQGTRFAFVIAGAVFGGWAVAVAALIPKKKTS